MAWINETDGLYTDLLTDTKDFKAAGIKMPPYVYYGYGVKKNKVLIKEKRDRIFMSYLFLY